MSKEKILLCKSLEKFIKVIFLIIMETCFCYATQTGDNKLFSFQWRMVQTTPCAINGEQPVIVSFGNVGISKIDTGRYVQDLNYSLNCGGATSKDNVLMFIKANPTTWDAKAIATNITGLGAQVLKEGAPLELNTDILISDPAAPPALQIRLVKEPDAILTDQPFTATGTMIVEYM
ncbi:fimbrial protein [Enterobacter sp. ASE]|uniref:fimbrial protein n=1 Tax=Enterobacter sp. ASE TaxID=2905968 RepID=UPI001E5EC64B|nr:fimbrial protein [Enterobacter sp. ASE]MCE3115171.1 fimbrial protein [Enterobacter sp. ASE]